MTAYFLFFLQLSENGQLTSKKVGFWNFGSLIVVEYEFQVSLQYLNEGGSYGGGSKQKIHPVVDGLHQSM